MNETFFEIEPEIKVKVAVKESKSNTKINNQKEGDTND